MEMRMVSPDLPRCRGPEKHEKGRLRNKWHIHIGPINHIPLK
jgi:hypothetical protein